MPRDSLELLMGIDSGGNERPSFKPSAKTYRHTPRMLRMAVDKWRFARQVETFLPPAQARYRLLRRGSLGQLSERELLAEIDRLYELTRQTAYFNIITPLLMGLDNRLLAAQLARCGVDVAQVNVTHGLNALRDVDLTIHLEQLNRKFNGLAEAEIDCWPCRKQSILKTGCLQVHREARFLQSRQTQQQAGQATRSRSSSGIWQRLLSASAI